MLCINACSSKTDQIDCHCLLDDQSLQIHEIFHFGLIYCYYYTIRCPIATMADEVKDYFKNYRLGFSRNYTKLDPAANFPLYTTHQCMVRKHLTKEVSALSFSVSSGLQVKGQYA